MALHFSTSSSIKYEIAITADPSLDMTQEEKDNYLKSGDNSLLKKLPNEEPTIFILKPLSPKDRETAELKAGGYTRSELGRILWLEEPRGIKDKAYWRENLSDIEKKALADYEGYLNRVYEEMIKVSVIEVKGVPFNDIMDLLNSIRPDAFRLKAISELIFHIQRLSLLSNEGK